MHRTIASHDAKRFDAPFYVGWPIFQKEWKGKKVLKRAGTQGWLDCWPAQIKPSSWSGLIQPQSPQRITSGSSETPQPGHVIVPVVSACLKRVRIDVMGSLISRVARASRRSRRSPGRLIVFVRVAFVVVHIPILVIEGGLVQLFPSSKDPPRVALAGLGVGAAQVANAVDGHGEVVPRPQLAAIAARGHEAVDGDSFCGSCSISEGLGTWTNDWCFNLYGHIP